MDYRHKQANSQLQERNEKKYKVTKMAADTIDDYICKKWSPEQIAKRLLQEGIIDLHHEIVYQYILSDKQSGGDLYTHLRHQNKAYRKRYESAHSRNGLPNRTDIDERPNAANNRERIKKLRD